VAGLASCGTRAFEDLLKHMIFWKGSRYSK